MIKAVLLFCALLAAGPALAADVIRVPDDKDEYSTLVARLESGDETVDFRSLRLAYLSSVARKSEDEGVYRQLNLDLGAALESDDAAEIRARAVAVLNYRYVLGYVHGVLAGACLQMKDTQCSQHADFVARGLLNSILNSGNGQSCATGWEVINPEEEVFALGMQNLTRQSRSYVTDDSHACEKMTVTTRRGQERTVYFNMDAALKVFQQQGAQ